MWTSFISAMELRTYCKIGMLISYSAYWRALCSPFNKDQIRLVGCLGCWSKPYRVKWKHPPLPQLAVIVTLFQGDFRSSACKYTVVSFFLMSRKKHDLLILISKKEVKQKMWVLCVTGGITFWQERIKLSVSLHFFQYVVAKGSVGTHSSATGWAGRLAWRWAKWVTQCLPCKTTVAISNKVLRLQLENPKSLISKNLMHIAWQNRN